MECRCDLLHIIQAEMVGGLDAMMKDYHRVTNGEIGEYARLDLDGVPKHKVAMFMPLSDAGPPPHDADFERVERSLAISAGSVVASYRVVALPASVDRVRLEAQRRIMALMGARDLTHCLIKQLNANMRANELNDKRASGGELTPEENAEAQMLRSMADAIKAIRAASNVLEASPPADYRDGRHWPAT